VWEFDYVFVSAVVSNGLGWLLDGGRNLRFCGRRGMFYGLTVRGRGVARVRMGGLLLSEWCIGSVLVRNGMLVLLDDAGECIM